MSQRFDPNIVFQLATGVGPNPVSDISANTALVEEAVVRAIDYLCGGDHREARISVQTGGKLTWILFGASLPEGVRDFAGDEGVRDLQYWARTNDIDLFAGCPPTFHVLSQDPGVVQSQVTYFLAQGVRGNDVTIRIYRTESGAAEAVEEATSATDEFREVPVFPGL